jgi:hypothetical protein
LSGVFEPDELAGLRSQYRFNNKRIVIDNIALAKFNEIAEAGVQIFRKGVLPGLGIGNEVEPLQVDSGHLVQVLLDRTGKSDIHHRGLIFF